MRKKLVLKYACKIVSISILVSKPAIEKRRRRNSSHTRDPLSSPLEEGFSVCWCSLHPPCQLPLVGVSALVTRGMNQLGKTIFLDHSTRENFQRNIDILVLGYLWKVFNWAKIGLFMRPLSLSCCCWPKSLLWSLSRASLHLETVLMVSSHLTKASPSIYLQEQDDTNSSGSRQRLSAREQKRGHTFNNLFQLSQIDHIGWNHCQCHKQQYRSKNHWWNSHSSYL